MSEQAKIYESQDALADDLQRQLAEAQAEAKGWRCFHCGEAFTTWGAAQDHFGSTPESKAGCLIDRVALEEGGKTERGRGLLMALRKSEAALAAATQEHELAVREAFKAGFLAAPDPEAETFRWVFNGFNMAADREKSAWDAYVKFLSSPARTEPADDDPSVQILEKEVLGTTASSPDEEIQRLSELDGPARGAPDAVDVRSAESTPSESTGFSISPPARTEKRQCPYCKEWCSHGFCGRCERVLDSPARTEPTQ